MGRGKIEIKRIENQTNRQVTFSKRRNGLLKKAKEIAVLCDAKVSVIIFASNSKMYCSNTRPETLSSILEEYHKHSGQRLWDAKHEDLNSEIERVRKENENMNIELKHFKAEDIQSLNHRELITLENLLENGLTCIRENKAEFIRTLRERRDIMEAEYARLQYKLYQSEVDIQGNTGDAYNNQRINNNANMPFGFRVQPMQPNLQDRI